MKNGGISIDISNVTDKYEVVSFKLSEQLGGEIANGEFSLISRPDMTTDFYDVVISISDTSGYNIEFNAYVYSLSYDETYLNAKFICSTPDFTTVNIVKSYSSVLDAINSNWSGNFIYPTNSDIKCDIHQRSETGYQLVQKLIRGLRFKSVYGFRCNELIVRDLNDDIDKDLSNDEFSVRSSNLVLSKSKVRDLSVKLEDIGVSTSLTYSKSFKQVRSEYSNLIRNFLTNNSLIKVLGSYRTQIRYTKCIPNMNICDIVRQHIKNISINKFVVYSRLMTWNTETGLVTDIDLIGYDW